MTRCRASSIRVRLDTGICFTISLRGVVEVSRDLVEQVPNVRVQYNKVTFDFPTIHALFNALAQFETVRSTTELEAVQ